MRPLVPVAILSLLVAPLLLGSAGAAETGRYLVGYSQGDDAAAHLAIQAAGGRVERSNAELGFAVVTAADGSSFTRLASASPAIDYVERDDPIHLAGAQWNGAQWNGAQWNGAQWNGAQWNGAQWNGAQWNGAQWNGAQWNAAKWTTTHYAGSKPSGWSYDLATTDPGLSWQWGAWAMRQPGAWMIETGSRATSACILDSGIAWDHLDLDANVERSAAYNAMDPKASAYDDAGHGTHIAGLVGAELGNAYGIAGGANVRLIPIKVFDANGRGFESDLAFGLAWCAAQGASLGVMALSASEPGPTLDRALDHAADRGVLLMASAGNGGTTSGAAYPASHPRVVGVGAVDGKLEAPAFSQRGPGVDLAAPGVDVLSTFPGGRFVFGSGTSQAVASAAGVAALLFEANSAMDAESVAAILASTAKDLGPLGTDGTFGAGLVDATAALAAAG